MLIRIQHDKLCFVKASLMQTSTYGRPTIGAYNQLRSSSKWSFYLYFHLILYEGFLYQYLNWNPTLSFVNEIFASSIHMRFINFTNPMQHTHRTEKRQCDARLKKEQRLAQVKNTDKNWIQSYSFFKIFICNFRYIHAQQSECVLQGFPVTSIQSSVVKWRMR